MSTKAIPPAIPIPQVRRKLVNSWGLPIGIQPIAVKSLPLSGSLVGGRFGLLSWQKILIRIMGAERGASGQQWSGKALQSGVVYGSPKPHLNGVQCPSGSHVSPGIVLTQHLSTCNGSHQPSCMVSSPGHARPNSQVPGLPVFSPTQSCPGSVSGTQHLCPNEQTGSGGLIPS